MGYNPIGGDPNPQVPRPNPVVYYMTYVMVVMNKHVIPDQHIGMAHYHKLMVIEIQKERLKNFVHG